METTVSFAGGVKFEVNTRGHRVMCDQPKDNHGADEGMSPPEFLLASLGTCAAYYALEYLRTRSLAETGLTVHVQAQKELRPARLGLFRISIEAPGADTERHREGLLRAVKTCLVHNTLLNPPAIQVEVNTAVAV